MLTDVTVKPRETEFERDEIEHRHRFLHILGWLVVVLAIAAVAWYEYPNLKRYEAQLTQITVVQKAMDGIGDQVKQTDAKLQAWAGDQQNLRDQIGKLRMTTRAQLDAAVKQVEESSVHAYRQVQAQIDERFQGVQNRLARLESSSDAEQTRVAALRSELDQVRQDSARQAADLAAIRQQVEQSGALHDRELANLKHGEETARRDVDAIEQKLAVRRVDFEVTKNRSHEIAEGISLEVTRTDPALRTVSGWMRIVPDRRTIWMKSQNAQQPVVFYGSQDGKKRELVITNVTRNSIVGYLLLPADSTDRAPGRAGE